MNSRQSDRRAGACPVCGAVAGEDLATLNYAMFDDLCLPGRKVMMRCDRCGMVYDAVCFSEEHLLEYYRANEHYAASSIGGTGSFSDENAARYERILSTLSLKPGSLALDVGCGQGGFVAYCRKQGVAAVGIEPSEGSRAAAHELGLEVYVSLETFRAARRQAAVDAVVVSHVLEHLLQPLKLLRRIALLTAGATVYIEVPDATSYLAAGAVRWQELYFEHVAHFQQKNLADIARRAGIGVHDAGTYGFSTAQPETGCCFLLGEFNGRVQSGGGPALADKTCIEPLPPVPEVILPDRRHSLALWGVSQYAMLLMGSRPELAGMTRLFDASPAKAGRTVRGTLIEPPEALTTLRTDAVLLLPRSPYTNGMIDHLTAIGYRGTYIIV